MALTVLGFGLAALGLAFATEVVTAIETWEGSTAYNHCWLVLPVALWLAWNRRHRLAGLAPRPAPYAAAGALAAGMAWLVAERLGIMEGRQLAATAMTICFIVAVVGWQIGRVMAGPMLYLFFLVPFGAFLVPLLQKVTAWFIVSGLNLMQIPNFHDDLVIEIPAGTFLVAEACAGLRFFVAALAFGGLYALVMFRSPWRRLAVMGLAVVVPIIANGFRALGIVLMGHYLGSAEAAAADHVLYGWIFFSLVILLLVAAGLPFREDAEPEHAVVPPAARPSRGGAVTLASAFLCGLAALAGPAAAAMLDRAGGVEAEASPVPFFQPEGCAPAAGGALRCGDATLVARLVAFSPHSTWSRVSAERYRLAGSDDEALTFSVSSAAGGWQVRQDRKGGRIVATAAWLQGMPAGDGLRSRLAQGWNSLHGNQGQPVLATLLWRPDRPRDAGEAARDRAWLRAVLESQSVELAQHAAALSTAR
jgi:exosortase A